MGFSDWVRISRWRDTLLSVAGALMSGGKPGSKREFLLRLLQGMVDRNRWRG